LTPAARSRTTTLLRLHPSYTSLRSLQVCLSSINKYSW